MSAHRRRRRAGCLGEFACPPWPSTEELNDPLTRRIGECVEHHGNVGRHATIVTISQKYCQAEYSSAGIGQEARQAGQAVAVWVSGVPVRASLCARCIGAIPPGAPSRRPETGISAVARRERRPRTAWCGTVTDPSADRGPALGPRSAEVSAPARGRAMIPRMCADTRP